MTKAIEKESPGNSKLDSRVTWDQDTKKYSRLHYIHKTLSINFPSASWLLGYISAELLKLGLHLG